jgi:hypothetical protein
VYYFYQYTLRSAPAVMMPQLSDAFGLARRRSPRWSGCSTTAIRRSASSPAWRWIASVRGGRADRRGRGRHRRAALLDGISQAASIGRLLQGAGGVFALVGAAYIATTNFPPRAPRPSSARRRCSAWPAGPPASSSSVR